MSVTYFNWQGGLQPGAPYTTTSPNLIAIRNEIGKRFGGTYLGGYGVRPVRAGTAFSSHAFGAAIDWRIESASVRASCAEWLVTNYELLGVQAVHDYVNSRVWRANRYPGQSPQTWWRPQTPNAANGMGQAWAVWLHIETDQRNWSRNTPISSRTGVSTNPPPPVAPPVLFDPAKGQWGLYPLNKSKATIREVSTPPSREVHDLTLYAQGVLRLKAGQPITIDGDFGPSTSNAVKNLQGFFGMVVDGVVGPKTWGVIDMLASK